MLRCLQAADFHPSWKLLKKVNSAEGFFDKEAYQ